MGVFRWNPDDDDDDPTDRWVTSSEAKEPWNCGKRKKSCKAVLKRWNPWSEVDTSDHGPRGVTGTPALMGRAQRRTSEMFMMTMETSSSRSRGDVVLDDGLEMEGLTCLLTERRDGGALRLGEVARSHGAMRRRTIQGLAQSLTGRRDGTIRRTELSEHQGGGLSQRVADP